MSGYAVLVGPVFPKNFVRSFDQPRAGKCTLQALRNIAEDLIFILFFLCTGCCAHVGIVFT